MDGLIVRPLALESRRAACGWGLARLGRDVMLLQPFHDRLTLEGFCRRVFAGGFYGINEVQGHISSLTICSDHRVSHQQHRDRAAHIVLQKSTG
eukprot:1013426-Prymnesium_polylepis.1